MDVKLDPITGMPYSQDYFTKISTNPVVLIIIIIVMILYYFMFSSLGSSAAPISEETGNGGMVFLEVLLWAVFIVLILTNGASYFLNADITASLKGLFTNNPEIDIIVDPQDINTTSDDVPVPEIKIEKQVFYIPDTLKYVLHV